MRIIDNLWKALLSLKHKYYYIIETETTSAIYLDVLVAFSSDIATFHLSGKFLNPQGKELKLATGSPRN